MCTQSTVMYTHTHTHTRARVHCTLRRTELDSSGTVHRSVFSVDKSTTVVANVDTLRRHTHTHTHTHRASGMHG